MAEGEDQQFCLRWNNFQANITSQFETLRDDEDFTDVTIACDGQRLQAHKVVLSACSPFFKELFKTNPCSHPIVFMRDVEARHIVALLEFMYAGEVNVAQAHLSTFLKTAESLKIRGLTDTSTGIEPSKDENSLFLNPQPSSSKQQNCSLKRLSSSKQVSSSSTVTSSQDIEYPVNTSPPLKRQCKTETESLPVKEESMSVNPFALQLENKSLLDLDDITVQPKVELPDYSSDDELNSGASTVQLPGGMEIIAQTPNLNAKDNNVETPGHSRLRRRRATDIILPFSLTMAEKLSDGPPPDVVARIKALHEHRDGKQSKLVKLGEGIEIYEEQLRSVKWSDYRKLTRGLATILFSPAELATCSVTGQRWSRAGNGERPVKPALDRSKVQAIISYVAKRFPMVEISRIKQVLAYKCKENSTAFRMKAVRYYGDQQQSK